MKHPIWPWLCAVLAAVSCSDDSATTPGDGAAADGADAPCCAEDLGVAEVPSTSVFQLRSAWTDQDETARQLSDFRGEVAVVAMIFTNCSFACPRILSDLEEIEGGLSAAQKASVRFLLVSMDDERDTPRVLHAYAEKNGLGPRWTLLAGEPGDIRELAAVLGVRYKKAPSGDFSHSNLITVLDREGRIVEQQEGLGAPAAPTVAAIARVVDS